MVCKTIIRRFDSDPRLQIFPLFCSPPLIQHTRSEDMADIQRISVQEAHTKTKANQALLVCAYEDEAKCQRLNLEGSISFTSLQSRATSLPKAQELIFY